MHKFRVQRRQICFYRGNGGLRGDVVNRVHWRKMRVRSIVAFHWLNYNSLSLAEWLLGQETIPLPAGVVGEKHLPVRDGIDKER